MKNKLSKIMVTLLVGLMVGCGSGNHDDTSLPTPDVSSFDDSSPVLNGDVVDYMLDGERKYTGHLENGVPEGNGTLEWIFTNCLYEGEFKNGIYEGEGTFYWRGIGDKFEGTFQNGEPYYGTYTYANTMHYVGYMKDWKFHGKGLFDWNTYNEDGSVRSYGWLYEGDFLNGSTTGCKGRLTMTRIPKQAAVYWFEGELDGFPHIKPNQYGKCHIRYPDKSEYTGDVYYNGQDYLRIGKGELDFSECLYQAGPWGTSNDQYLYKYVGEFDSRVSGWIHGNGVCYYVDKEGHPSKWAKGYFDQNNYIGEYEGEDITLLEGYTLDMETRYLRFRENYDVYMTDEAYAHQHHKYLFVGDSYMTFMNSNPDTPFKKYFGDYDALNVGCGGSTTADWLNYYEDLVKPYSPENIVLHIGGNDMNCNSNIERVEKQLRKFIDMCRKDFPNVKFYLVGSTLSPNNMNYWNTRWALLQELFHKLADEYQDFVVIETLDLVTKNVETLEPIDDLASYFLSDGTHLNDKGYTMWSNRVKEYLK